jgi:DNA helicase-2/ATP-dependent DNA helicase PcrA
MLFGEMIIETYHYLRDNPQCPERRMFDHVLVDEYQDLNKAEQVVIELLATNCNLAIIGDDDQSIYSFKYAHPDGIRDFPENHRDCSEIDFDACRRCPKQVVAMASRLINNNDDRTLGDLKPFGNNQNGNVRIVQWRDLDSEISGICNIIKKNIEAGRIRPEDVLVLTPLRKIGYRLRDFLVNAGVSAKSYFREDALRNDTLRYNFSLLNLAANRDDLVALRYLLGFGSQTYRAASYRYITAYAKQNHTTIGKTFEKLKNGEIKIPKTTALLKRYIEVEQEVDKVKVTLNKDRGKLLDLFAPDNPDDAEFRSILQWAIDDISNQDVGPLNEWLTKIFSFALEKISFPENVEAKDHARIMSFHASKGLSAKFVIVMSCIDDLLPRTDPNREISIEEQTEEQRRLFYVAITRCKSSQTDYPGMLIISSFVGLPGNEALGFGIPASANKWRRTNATRFIREFEDTAPQTIHP